MNEACTGGFFDSATSRQGSGQETRGKICSYYVYFCLPSF